ncbi:MAG: archease [Nitrospinota bacterium]
MGKKAGYRLFETTADVGVEAWGKTLQELFANAARGLFDVICSGGPRHGAGDDRPLKFSVELRAEDLGGLLVGWLNELIYLQTVKGFLLRKVDFERLEQGELRATLWGESYDPRIHGAGVEVKAATYHRLEVAPEDQGWRCRVILDI